MNAPAPTELLIETLSERQPSNGGYIIVSVDERDDIVALLRQAASVGAEPVKPTGDIITVKVPDGYDSVADFLDDCGLEAVYPVERAEVAGEAVALDQLDGALCNYLNQVGDRFEPKAQWVDFCWRGYERLSKAYNAWHKIRLASPSRSEGVSKGEVQSGDATRIDRARDPLIGMVASLAAAISLLEKTPKSKEAAPSDSMFEIMLSDYRKALEAGREFTKNYRDAYEHGYNDGCEWQATHGVAQAPIKYCSFPDCECDRGRIAAHICPAGLPDPPNETSPLPSANGGAGA